MMYKTIREFMNFNNHCPTCNDALTPIMRVDGADNVYPNDNFIVDKKNHYVSSSSFFGNFRKKVQYKSKVEDNHLYLEQYINNSLNEIICDIDIDTNLNHTAVRPFHKCLSTYSCRIGLSCYKQECIDKCAYYFYSDKLYVDYKNNKLYTTKLNTQIFGVPFNDDYYLLSSDDNKTLLTTRDKIVGDFPRIELKDLNYQGVVRKIKTLLVFG